MKHLLQLNANDCRWPLGECMFCAAPKVRGAYCAEHAERAYKAQTEPSTTDSPAPNLVAHGGQYNRTPTKMQH